MCFWTKFDWAPAAPATPPVYWPRAARPLVSALLRSSSWPAATSCPAQALRHEACSARPNEKLSLNYKLDPVKTLCPTYFQGLGTPLYWLMALRFTEASSSDWPPERNTIPGMAGGTVRARAVTVALPTSSGLALTPEL